MPRMVLSNNPDKQDDGRFVRLFWTNDTKLVLLWAQLTKIYLPLPISVQPISITKTLPIVPTKNYPADDYLLKFYQIPSYITKIFLWHCIKYKAPNSGTIKVNIIKNEKETFLFLWMYHCFCRRCCWSLKVPV